MTTLITWFGHDSHGPASIYIASDSRITWGQVAKWDRARKVFASKRYPEILGYCGDAFFPSQLLGQAVELLDRDLLFKSNDRSTTKVGAIRSFVEASLQTYTSVSSLRFQLVYACREGEGMKSRFCLHRVSFRGGTWDEEGPLPLPDGSALLMNLGTGASSISANMSRWSRSVSGGTSRSVFSAFCDSLSSGSDPSSGGPPQLVGLYRKGEAQVFGIIWEHRPYVLGTEILGVGAGALELRNSLFERCDQKTMKRLADAQRQPRPPDV